MEMTLAGTGGQMVSLSRKQKAAIVVRLLRNEGIDLSLAGLPDGMQVGLTREMGSLRFVTRDTLKSVIAEFVSELDTIGLSFPKGVTDALELMGGSLSPAAADILRVEAGIGLVTDAWERLSELSAERLAAMLQEESTEIGAVALSKLKVSKAAEVLGLMPGDKARRLAFAMGQTGKVGPTTVARIGDALIAQLDSEAPRAFEGGPVERVGAILNFSPSTTRDDVLDGLDKEDREFANEVRKAIFTFVNIPERIDPRDVPKITREVEQTVLITALAAAQGKEKETKAAEFILSSMSQRLAQQMRDEMETLGKVRAKDGEDAMNEVVTAIRAMEADGKLMLVAGED